MNWLFVLELFGTIICAALLLGWFVTRRPSNSPPIVGTIPFIGCALSFATDPLRVVKQGQKLFNDIFTLRIVGFHMTFLVGPEAHAAFFKATDEELSPKEAYQFVVPVFGPGVVYDSPTQIMYEQLRFVKSGLVVSQLKKSIPIIAREATDFFHQWGDSGQVDMLDTMNKLTILTASRCLLGREVRDDPQVSAEFAALYHDLEGGLNPIAFFFPNAPIPAHRKRDHARIEICKLFSKIIKARRQLPASERPDDMTQVLMEAVYKNGEILEDDKITGLLIALLFAGQHTSGITSSWTGFFILSNRKYFDELVEEQRQVREQFGDEITFEVIKSCVKMENCIREALRLFPPLIILMRKVIKEIKYKDFVIPVGDLLCVSPGCAMRLPEVFTNADTYDPDRFVRGEDTNTPFSYIAFGGGRHGCPGEPFAILQIKTLWTVLLRNFDLEAVGALPVPDYTNLVVGPKQPCKISYKRKVTE